MFLSKYPSVCHLSDTEVPGTKHRIPGMGHQGVPLRAMIGIWFIKCKQCTEPYVKPK